MNKLQILRRLVQISGIILIIAIPFLSLYGVLVENYRISMVNGEGWQRFFDYVDRAVRYFSDDTAKAARSVKGTLFWSITIFGFNISDPLTFLGNIFGSKGFYLKLFIAILPLVSITAVLGRVYCGWICPMNLLFELNGKMRNVLRKAGVKPFNVGFARLNKYALLLMGGILSLILGVQVYSFIYPPIVFNREVIHLIYFGSVGIGAVFLIILFLFEVSISQRAWCRYFCPGGALWSLMGIKRLVKVEWDKKLCDDCGKCISKCAPDALKYSIIMPWQKGGIKKERDEKKSEFKEVSN